MKIQEAVMKYLYWFQYDRRARPASIFNRTRELNRLVFRWFNMEVEDILEEHVEELKQDMNKKGYSVNYIRKMLFVVRALFRYLREEKKLTVIERHEIKVPKAPKIKVSYFSHNEIGQLFTFQPETIFDLRLMAWVMLILSTGMRANESLGVLRTKIDQQEVEWEGKKTKVFVSVIEGKGGFYRTVIIQPWAMEWLQAYWNMRTDDHQAAFVNHAHHKVGKEFSYWKYEDLRVGLKRLKNIVGRTVKSHELRRTAATLTRFNGASVKDIQEMLGHQSLQYTDLYLGVDYNHLAFQLSKHVRYTAMPRAPMTTKGVWAIGLNIPACRECGTTERKHSAKGFCHNCYMNRVNRQKRERLTNIQAGRMIEDI